MENPAAFLCLNIGVPVYGHTCLVASKLLKRLFLCTETVIFYVLI